MKRLFSTTFSAMRWGITAAGLHQKKLQNQFMSGVDGHLTPIYIRIMETARETLVEELNACQTKER